MFTKDPFTHASVTTSSECTEKMNNLTQLYLNYFDEFPKSLLLSIEMKWFLLLVLVLVLIYAKDESGQSAMSINNNLCIGLDWQRHLHFMQCVH